MYLRTWIISFLACWMALSLTAADKPVNVILILCDDVGYECFSSYGSEEYYTPRLDQLAAEGIRFTNAHSTPLCTPSRVNLMTGKSNVFNYFDFGIFPTNEPTIANHYKQLGYKTAVAGKWQLWAKDKSDGISPTEAGFDTYCLWNMPLTTTQRYWDPSLDQNGKLLDLPDGSYGPKVVNDFLVDFIKENKDEPFFVYNPLILPHSPFPPTPHSISLKEKDEKKNFIDMVQYVDFVVGRLVDTLEELGLRENTLIVFTSDNGTHHKLISELPNKSVPGGKGWTHDYGTHVPLIVNWPGHVQGGQVNEDLIAFSDIYPTIVDATGVTPKNKTDEDGISFWPQCTGQDGTKREAIYGYYFPRPYAETFDDFYRHWEVRWARDKRYKLYGNGDLYDTLKDVMERSPIRPENESRAQRTAREKLKQVIAGFPSQGQRIDYQRVNGKMPNVFHRSPADQ